MVDGRAAALLTALSASRAARRSMSAPSTLLGPLVYRIASEPRKRMILFMR